jgi:propionyl-CoA carboxylase alpha chain
VASVHAASGDRITAGQLLVVLEAMKMEQRITAPAGGTLAELRVAAGDAVDAGCVLAVVDEDA